MLRRPSCQSPLQALYLHRHLPSTSHQQQAFPSPYRDASELRSESITETDYSGLRPGLSRRAVRNHLTRFELLKVSAFTFLTLAGRWTLTGVCPSARALVYRFAGRIPYMVRR